MLSSPPNKEEEPDTLDDFACDHHLKIEDACKGRMRLINGGWGCVYAGKTQHAWVKALVLSLFCDHDFAGRQGMTHLRQKITQAFGRDLGLHKEQVRLELSRQTSYLHIVFSLRHHLQVVFGPEQPLQTDSEDLFSVRDQDPDELATAWR